MYKSRCGMKYAADKRMQDRGAGRGRKDKETAKRAKAFTFVLDNLIPISQVHRKVSKRLITLTFITY